MPGNIGPLEVGIVLVIALIVFGPKRLPEFGRGLGRGIREFKESVTGADVEEHTAVEQGNVPPAATPPVESPTTHRG